MASVVAETTWVDSRPDEIESALAQLWRQAGRATPVTRAVMSNVVIVRTCASGESRADVDDPAVDAVAALHPSRIIVLSHEDGCPLARAPIGARVGITAFGPRQARYAVERVVVRSSCEESSLPSIVRRLIRGDLPTSIWYQDDLSLRSPIGAILAEGRQLIYDSRTWSDLRGFRAVALAVRSSDIDVADLNWRRLAPVRQALCQVDAEAAIDDLKRGAVRITYAPAEAALGWLLYGWLASRVAWRRPAPQPRPDADAAAALVTLNIGDATGAITVALTPGQVRVAQHGSPPYAVTVRRESLTDAVVDELRTIASDASLRDTVEAIARVTSEESS